MLLVFFIGARTCDNKMERLTGARGIADGRERSEQQVASFLFVQTTQKEQKPLVAKMGKAREEILARACKIYFRCRCSVVHDYFIASIEGKGFASHTPFLFR